jgi:hypothetical protein
VRITGNGRHWLAGGRTRQHDYWSDVTRGFDVLVIKTDDVRLWFTLIASALCLEMVTRLDGLIGSEHGLFG